ncbi:MAG: hypothetical protein ACJA0W_003242 [Candidatus Azotimanducaceae bacterium]|jgi:hypothetical protein
MAKTYFQWFILLLLSPNAFGGDSALDGPSLAVNSVEAVRLQLVGMEWRSDQYDWQAERAAEGPLAAIVRTESEPHFIRGRALEALTLLPGSLAREVFQELIAQDQSPVLRRRAVDSLCAMPVETSNANNFLHSLLPLLASPDRHLGVRVARCLATMDGPSERITLSLQRYVARSEAWEIQSAGLQRDSK